ncbi:MAG: TolC family protein [Thermacetogeniaceae bacterium]
MKKLFASFLVLVLVAALLFPGVVFAEANAAAPQELSLEQAISLAIANSNDLKQAKADVKAAEITRDEVWKLNNAVLMKTYIPGTDLHVSVPTDQDPQGKVYITNFDWLAKQKNYEMKVDSVVLSVYQKYYNVLQALADLEAKELAAEQYQQQPAIARLRVSVGLDSPVSLTSVQAQAAAANAALDAAKKNLDKAYSELVDLLGLPEGSRPKLTDTVVYEKLNIDCDVEAYIDDIAENSPPVWIANESVRLVKQTWGMNQFASYDLDKANLEKAQASVETTKETMKQIARQLYYSAKDLEGKYDAALQQLKAAEEFARITRLQFDVGMATKAQVTAADAAVASAKYGLLALQCNHDLLVRAMQKPWAASVITGGLGSGSAASSGSSSGSAAGGSTSSASGSSGQMASASFAAGM